MTMRAQELIAPGRAVPADHVDFGVGPAQLSREIVQQIKNLGVVVADVAGTVIAQVAIKVIEGAGNVMVAFAINDIQVFTGVQVEQLQPVLRLSGDGGMSRCGSQKCTRQQSNHNFQ